MCEKVPKQEEVSRYVQKSTNSCKPQRLPQELHLWSDRAYFNLAMWGATTLSVASLCVLSAVRSPAGKLAVSIATLSTAVIGLNCRERHYNADRRVRNWEYAALGGHAQSAVREMQPIDARSDRDGIDRVEDKAIELDTDEDDTIAQILELEDPIARQLLLGLIELGIDVEADSIVKRVESDRGIGYLLRLPSGVRSSKVAGMAADLMSKASLPVVPIIEVVSGGVKIILEKPQPIASPGVAAPSIAIPIADRVAVESDAPITESDRLPDGARLIEMTALNNIDRYPVLMVIAGQGSGKTATMAAILSVLDGFKAIASPKPLSGATQAIADLIFGFDSDQCRWLYFGDYENTNYSEDRDLEFHRNRDTKLSGSMLNFLWACRRESMNRQLDPKRDRTPWRCFFDEASYTYTSGFNDPMSDGKLEKQAQQFISGVNKDAFQNYRGQAIQTFFGAQVKTVDSIGLKGFAAARDEAWWLFPGLAAITEARSLGKFQLANWMQRRVEQGYGVALLNKQDSIFEVINLPDIATLDRFSKD